MENFLKSCDHLGLFEIKLGIKKYPLVNKSSITQEKGPEHIDLSSKIFNFYIYLTLSALNNDQMEHALIEKAKSRSGNSEMIIDFGEEALVKFVLFLLNFPRMMINLTNFWNHKINKNCQYYRQDPLVKF